VQCKVCEHTVDSNSVGSAASVSMTTQKEEGYEEFGSEPFLQELCAPLQGCTTECSIAQVTYSSNSHSADDDGEQGRPHRQTPQQPTTLWLAYPCCHPNSM